MDNASANQGQAASSDPGNIVDRYTDAALNDTEDLVSRIERLFDKFDQMEFVHAESAESVRHASTAMEALAERVDHVEAERRRLIADANGIPDDNHRTSQAGAELEPILERLTVLENAMHDMQTSFGTAEATLADVHTALGTLTESGVDGALQSMSKTVAEMGAMLKDCADRQSLAERRSAVAKGFGTQSGADRSEVMSVLGEIRGSLEALPVLAERVEMLRLRPDPVMDMGPQRRSFSQFASVLKTIVARMEHATAAVETLSDRKQTPGTNDVVSALNELRDAILSRPGPMGGADPGGLPEQFDRIEQRLEEIALVAARTVPAPRPEIATAEARRELTRFNIAAAGVLRRMESVTDDLETKIGMLVTAAPPPPVAHPVITVGDVPGLSVTLATLAETNRLLATGHAAPAELRRLHERFLCDLRFVVAEYIALRLRSIPGDPSCSEAQAGGTGA